MDISVLSLYSDKRSLDEMEDYKYFKQLLVQIKESQTDIAGINDALKGIKRILNRFFGVEFEITLADNNLSSNMFCCNVFPPHKECKKIVDLIIEENVNEIEKLRTIWSEMKSWHIDLDSRLFHDLSCPFNPDEIAVILLYNIERVILSYFGLNRVNYLVNKAFYEKNFTMNKLARSNVCRNLFILPFMYSCMYKNYITDINSVELEGSIVKRYPVCDIYLGAVRKLIVYNGNSDMDKNIARFDADIYSTLDWIFYCINDLKYSTKLVKETLKKIIQTTQSYYIKNILIDIYLTFGNYNKDELLRENFNIIEIGDMHEKVKENFFKDAEITKDRNAVNRCLKVIKESVFDFLDSIGNAKKINQKDIDVLKVESGKIDNVDDKLYILDNVYSKISIVDAALTMLEDKDKSSKVKVSKSTLLDQRKQLKDIRDSVIKRELKSPNHTLFVKYPEGYEG